MVKTLLALGLLGGGAYWLLRSEPRAFGTSGIPYHPDLDDATAGAAFNESGGIPFLGDWFSNKASHELSDGRLNLGWIDGFLGNDTGNGDSGGALDFLEPDWSIFDMASPRGIRNNNPGNIEYTGTNWQGLDNPKSDGRFMRFVEPVWGIRAIARTLNTYQYTHGIDTIHGLVSRWAPSFENNVDAYAEHVAQSVGVSPYSSIDIGANLPKIIPAIIQHENGQQPYSATLINRGIALA